MKLGLLTVALVVVVAGVGIALGSGSSRRGRPPLRHGGAVAGRRGAPSGHRRPAQVTLETLGLAGPGQAGGPSGVRMPTVTPAGWREIFADDFPATERVRLGQFTGCVWRGSLTASACEGLPLTARRNWYGFPDGTTDGRDRGLYEPSQVISIGGGMLSFHLHSSPGSGHPLVAAIEPKPPASVDPGGNIRFGAYAIRVKLPSLRGYEVQFQLWPEHVHWPETGAIVFPSGALGTHTQAVVHYFGATSPHDQAVVNAELGSGWHTMVVGWQPGLVRFILDGRLVGRVTRGVPDEPMHLLLQTRVAEVGPAPVRAAAGVIDVAWVTEYARAA